MENQPEKSILFTPHTMGDLELPNRIVMAALTRCRADPKTGVANDMHVEYYSARASSGFILTECSAIRPDGNCFPGSVGIYSDEQVEGWKKVVDAVHAKGGKIYMQIWHSGRAAHSDHIGV
jgi:N-ethylmaleimide reductase